jgi:hypothetical protein
VERANPRVFAAAGCRTGAERNTTDPRWITAFYNSTLGPGAAVPGGAVAGMPLAALLAAWKAPFESSDPVRGGCPALPIPPAGAQPKRSSGAARFMNLGSIDLGPQR